jgi:hypothetical protein
MEVKPISKDAGSDFLPETSPSSMMINNNSKMEMNNSAKDKGHSDVEMSKLF